MNNFSISAKKKFSILLRLMKSSKFSSISPLNEDDQIVNEPKNKTEIFNEYFASKSRVDGSDGKNAECAKFGQHKYFSN